MFYYYGRKYRLAHLYPEPTHNTIIEPFAGSAAYSLHGERWKKNVILYDTYDVVIQMWEYLINATKKDVESLPVPEKGFDIRNIKNLSKAERYIMGFSINAGCASPRNIVTGYSRWGANKKYILKNLHKVKHWKVYNTSYKDVENTRATYFIDPPYKKEGEHYVESSSSLDYLSLGEWCESRCGQVIVCEGSNGDWLDFQTLVEKKGYKGRVTKEKVFVKSA